MRTVVRLYMQMRQPPAGAAQPPTAACLWAVGLTPVNQMLDIYMSPASSWYSMQPFHPSSVTTVKTDTPGMRLPTRWHARWRTGRCCYCPPGWCCTLQPATQRNKIQNSLQPATQTNIHQHNVKWIHLFITVIMSHERLQMCSTHYVDFGYHL